MYCSALPIAVAGEKRADDVVEFKPLRPRQLDVLHFTRQIADSTVTSLRLSGIQKWIVLLCYTTPCQSHSCSGRQTSPSISSDSISLTFWLAMQTSVLSK